MIRPPFYVSRRLVLQVQKGLPGKMPQTEGAKQQYLSLQFSTAGKRTQDGEMGKGPEAYASGPLEAYHSPRMAALTSSSMGS
ncbi:MAG: hypothetical protein DBX66_04725 [Clostridiales bacterium]|nr:MAG: hypothetical protein DBX66_04725 [Clostridiales bacterium]